MMNKEKFKKVKAGIKCCLSYMSCKPDVCPYYDKCDSIGPPDILLWDALEVLKDMEKDKKESKL